MTDAGDAGNGSAPDSRGHVRGWGTRERRARDGCTFGATATRHGVSYEASLILTFSLLVLGTGLAVTLLSFRATRASTTTMAHALFQEVSDHAVTRTRGFLLRSVPAAQTLGNLADLGLATNEPE